ncbi:MAG: hypothetical protein MR835_02415 [Erysipelotrichaceae bacterium]|nr:hypothetical protein [Erysipelotrichaceae bacterium]MDD6093403.1 hypothetical protein [bacterium]
MKSKILYITCAIMIFVTIYEITNTYGLFESNINMNADSKLATWNILINDTNIGKSETFTIDNFISEEDSTVASGKIAPGTSGYFNINIDPSTTQVSIRYDLTFDFSKLDNLFTITKVEEKNGYNLIKTGPNTYSNVITLNEIKENKTNNIRVHIKWNNNEENNDKDTEIGLTENNTLNIPVSITVLQYSGEKIEPYVEPVV